MEASIVVQFQDELSDLRGKLETANQGLTHKDEVIGSLSKELQES